jgi:hypothetical protein
MNQEKEIRLIKKHVWKHSNVNKIRKCPTEDMMSVGRDEAKEKEDASLLLKKRLCVVISLLGYIFSSSSFIQEFFLFIYGSGANLQTIITGAIGLMFQLVGLIMFYWLYYRIYEAGHCDCTHKSNTGFFALWNIRFIFSILEFLSIILMNSHDIDVLDKRVPFLFSIGPSVVLYYFSILPSISFLIGSCLPKSRQYNLFEKEEES